MGCAKGGVDPGISSRLKFPLVARMSWRGLTGGSDTSGGPAGAGGRSPDPPPRQSPPRVLPSLVLSLRAHGQVHHSISDRESIAGSTAGESCQCAWCDAVGRKVMQQGQRALPTIIAPPPASAPPRSGAARTPSPWHGTSPWQWTARYGPAPVVPS
jgi:hypothetical protein